jgi:hypothetical protein
MRFDSTDFFPDGSQEVTGIAKRVEACVAVCGGMSSGKGGIVQYRVFWLVMIVVHPGLFKSIRPGHSRLFVKNKGSDAASVPTSERLAVYMNSYTEFWQELYSDGFQNCRDKRPTRYVVAQR